MAAGRKFLSSKWDGMSPHLVGTLERCDKQGNTDNGFPAVLAPLTDFNLNLDAHWEAAFANANRSALGTLVELGGRVAGTSNLFGSETEGGAIRRMLSEVAQWAEKAAGGVVEAMEGRTGQTKLNATQIYTGGSYYQMEAAAHFRAYSDPLEEVERPVAELMSWVLPTMLEAGSRVFGVADAALKGNDILKAWMPSTSPPYVALTYRGKRYAPLVIASVSTTLSSPCDSKGRRVNTDVHLSLRSWTAADATDWARAMGGDSMVTMKQRTGR